MEMTLWGILSSVMMAIIAVLSVVSVCAVLLVARRLDREQREQWVHINTLTDFRRVVGETYATAESLRLAGQEFDRRLSALLASLHEFEKIAAGHYATREELRDTVNDFREDMTARHAQNLGVLTQILQKD
jgi:biopolymer transport protein ExbB/TolQ